MPAPETHVFNDDGTFPNNRLPVLLWRAAIPGGADAIERTFREHGWRGIWRDGIFDYHHYHATAHEVLGVGQGSVTVRLGGPEGEIVHLGAGDIVLLPAGTAHRNLGQSADLVVVGGYPAGQRPDLLRGTSGERPGADQDIARVAMPGANPVTGEPGPPAEWVEPS